MPKYMHLFAFYLHKIIIFFFQNKLNFLNNFECLMESLLEINNQINFDWSKQLNFLIGKLNFASGLLKNWFETEKKGMQQKNTNFFLAQILQNYNNLFIWIGFCNMILNAAIVQVKVLFIIHLLQTKYMHLFNTHVRI